METLASHTHDSQREDSNSVDMDSAADKALKLIEKIVCGEKASSRCMVAGASPRAGTLPIHQRLSSKQPHRSVLGGKRSLVGSSLSSSRCTGQQA